jgi:hypothetical protein
MGLRKALGFVISIIAAFILPTMGLAEPGLKLDVVPVKRIYSSREGLMMKFVFTAQSRTKLCLSKDILSQMRINIHRSGSGKLPLQPLVVHDNSVLFQEPMQIRWLDVGESITLRANLKRFRFADDNKWEPGEYSVEVIFNLCEQTPNDYVTASDKEIPVKSRQPGWFMIML